MKSLWDLCLCSMASCVVSFLAYSTAASLNPDLWVVSPALLLMCWHRCSGTVA